MEMDRNQLNKCLKELGAVYEQLGGSKVELGICGGAGLILTGLIDRTTRDIDTLFPVPWPKKLAEAFMNRAKKVKFGKRITVYFASRYDQVFFKVYAAADRGGYHVDDLLTLNPTEEEMLAAARWCLTHDTSDGFKKILRDMYEKLGYEKVAKQI